MVGVKSLILNILVFCSLFLSALTAVAGTVTLGFAPNGFPSTDSPEVIRSKVDAISGLLQKSLGPSSSLKVSGYLATTPEDLQQKLRDGKVDFAFLSALGFVEAESTTKLKVLLKKVWDQGYYHSVVAVKSSSKIRHLRDLKGKKIAFVDENSASGYLYPVTHLRSLGLQVPSDFKNVVYSGSHEKSVELLKKNEVDAIAVFSNTKDGSDSAWTSRPGSSNKIKSRELRVLWSSAAIPNDPFCVREEFYQRTPKVAHELMFALIEMNEDKETGPELRRLLGARGLMIATSQQYEPVRQMYQSFKNSSGSKP